MSKGDKKQRHRAKREAKKRASRRRDGVSPLKRLADAPGEVECWMGDQMDELGQMQIFTFKRGAGLSGVACFLVDRGVVGLKDAWARLGIDRRELEEMLEECRSRHLSMVRATPEQARRMVAGGVRWAYENGMRLPKDWVKTASLIGGVGDWMSADVSAFVKEFAGHPDDLRQRLIGEPYETYIRRKDIAFEFAEDAPYMDQKTGAYNDWPAGEQFDDDDEEDGTDESILDILPEEGLKKMIDQFTASALMLAARTATWLGERGEAASPELMRAWQSIILSRMISKGAMPNASEQEAAEMGLQVLEDLGGRIEEARFDEYDLGVDQALQHLQTDVLMMQKAVMEQGFGGSRG